jgi:hypothetical protein
MFHTDGDFLDHMSDCQHPYEFCAPRSWLLATMTRQTATVHNHQDSSVRKITVHEIRKLLKCHVPWFERRTRGSSDSYWCDPW